MEFAFVWNTKMDLNAVEQLKNVLSSMSIEKDQIIYEEGEPVGDGYILSIGKVQLFKNNRDGKLCFWCRLHSKIEIGA